MSWSWLAGPAPSSSGATGRRWRASARWSPAAGIRSGRSSRGGRWAATVARPERGVSLTVLRSAALGLITGLVLAATAVSFAESYRGLYEWSSRHSLAGAWAAIWPLQVDVFIAVGELALVVGLADRWTTRQRAGAWAVTVLGLAVSVGGNVGHVAGHDWTSRGTAAIPPFAGAAALAVGLGVLKRVVARQSMAPSAAASAVPAHSAPADAQDAARLALAASVAAGNPISQRQMMARFGLTRTTERKVRQAVLASSNGHGEGV
jgi:hypothetical protein